MADRITPTRRHNSFCFSDYDLRRLRADAALIVMGQVASSSEAFEMPARLEQPSEFSARFVFTLHAVVVSRELKGNVLPPFNRAVAVVTWGGQSREVAATVDGEAHLTEGDNVVLFLTRPPRAVDWVSSEMAPVPNFGRPPDIPFSVLGGFQGKYSITKEDTAIRQGSETAIPLATLLDGRR